MNSKERIERAWALYAQGKTWKEIAEDVGVHTGTIRRWLKQKTDGNGSSRRGGSGHHKIAGAKTITVLWDLLDEPRNKGENMASVGRKHDVSREYVRQIAKAAKEAGFSVIGGR